MVLDGLVYKGLKPVYWSPSSQTALAEAEVEYYDVDSPSIYVALEIVDKNGSQKVKNGDKLVIWTTTPWTLLANALLWQLAKTLHIAELNATIKAIL
nr:class I tRNA ligase family protein [Mycoplasmopsis bovis]